ncbi:hypothetical protein [Thiomonas sp.]|jgi:hypothetical protein|uniref:TubC N-terminal docking domain-related protein n=1 Tax=Thiomonas sp. TaxID=2047785 RepID=UPI002588CCCF|nr:hypothetical protein [Thiomonas sp.]
MTVAALLEEIRAAGLTLDTAPDGLRVSPKGRLTDELRQKIRAHKAELLAALNPPPDDRAVLEADAASRAVAAEVLALAAHPDRAEFALKNHADAIRHFRKMAADTERLAAMYRAKIDGHINAARKRLTPAEFDSWIEGMNR